MVRYKFLFFLILISNHTKPHTDCSHSYIQKQFTVIALQNIHIQQSSICRQKYSRWLGLTHGWSTSNGRYPGHHSFKFILFHHFIYKYYFIHLFLLAQCPVFTFPIIIPARRAGNGTTLIKSFLLFSSYITHTHISRRIGKLVVVREEDVEIIFDFIDPNLLANICMMDSLSFTFCCFRSRVKVLSFSNLTSCANIS